MFFIPAAVPRSPLLFPYCRVVHWLNEAEKLQIHLVTLERVFELAQWIAHVSSVVRTILILDLDRGSELTEILAGIDDASV